ncbi:biotin/lipoyl-binding protein [Anaeroselena agilis]|uniref:Biotin/lipoyl-binding protein n=1 Tax=Anaeroselena agilis TaxID=3063788 RepID=A0ABU3P403_9FIRM|nr:biotin/lipoyl-binding protein [Selenomonadales bacterium 4137-cl]
MFRPKSVAALTVVLVLAVAAWAMAAGPLVDQKGVLSGRVLADGLAVPGAGVREGDVLVRVEGLAGPAIAVRANIDGKVKEVLVKPGDTIRTGDVLVRIEPRK